MAKKSSLTQDEIRLIMNVESTEAQQDIHKLTKEIKDLEKMNRDYRKEMMKLEMQGKKNTKAWKNLNDVVNENSQKINKSRAMVSELEKTLSVTDLTMGQLKKQAQQLQRVLDNTSKSLNPEEYAETEKRLAGVKGRMGELKNEAKGMSSMIQYRGGIAAFLGNVYTKVAQFAVDGLKKVKEFITASTDMAAKAEGIDHAFNRIANKDYLKSLRTQTKGLISDFTLMQSSVRAENFGIPLQQLGKYLEFAQNRARDTGESVDYLVNSIVDGIGRKSPLILDNLGISTVRLQEEMKKTGDFAKAVGNIVDEEMAKAGPAIDTATDAATRKKVAWENLMLATGKYFTGFRSGWDNIVTKFAEGVADIISKGEPVTKTFEDQVKKVASLETEIGPLTSRYEELKTKTSLTEKEQKELNSIMNTIARTIPGVAEKFDRYGNALSINTVKVRAYIAAEKDRLKLMNKDLIDATGKEIKRTEKSVEDLKEKIAKGSYTVRKGGALTAHDETITYSGEEMDRFREQLAVEEDDLELHKAKMKEFTGDFIDDEIEAQKARISKRAEYLKMTKAQLEQEIKNLAEQKSSLEEVAREAYKINFPVGDDDPDGKPAKKTKAERDKEEYDKALKELEAYIAKEKAIIQQKYVDGKITRGQYDWELEQLEMEKLRRNLQIAGLSFEQQQEIEFKLFEMKKQILVQIAETEQEHFKKLQEQRAADAQDQQERNWDNLQKIAAQNMAAYKEEFEKKKEFQRKLTDIATSFGREIGDVTAEFMTNNEMTAKQGLANIALATLDALEATVNMAVVEGAVKALISSGDPITGAIKAAALTAAIRLAFSGAKGLIKASIGKIDGKSQSESASPGTGARVATGRESGGYVDVNRAQDGKYFRALLNPKKRGFVDRPTVIVGDGPAGKSKEWVASNDALENPTVAPIIRLLNEAQQAGNIRTIDLNHLMRSRMAGFAGGGFLYDNPLADTMRETGSTDPSLYIKNNGSIEMELIREMKDLLVYLKNNGVKAPVVLSEFQKQQKLMETSQNIGRK